MITIIPPALLLLPLLPARLLLLSHARFASKNVGKNLTIYLFICFVPVWEMAHLHLLQFVTHTYWYRYDMHGKEGGAVWNMTLAIFPNSEKRALMELNFRNTAYGTLHRVAGSCLFSCPFVHTHFVVQDTVHLPQEGFICLFCPIWGHPCQKQGNNKRLRPSCKLPWSSCCYYEARTHLSACLFRKYKKTMKKQVRTGQLTSP